MHIKFYLCINGKVILNWSFKQQALVNKVLNVLIP
jgi:hypothetical protein